MSAAVETLADDFAEAVRIAADGFGVSRLLLALPSLLPVLAKVDLCAKILPVNALV
jgi:hypothetical protein